MATTYTFTLRPGGGTLADAGFTYGGGRYDVDDALAAGSGTITTTDDALASLLRGLTRSDGLLLLVEGGATPGGTPLDRRGSVPVFVQGDQPTARPYLWEKTSSGVPTGVLEYHDGTSPVLVGSASRATAVVETPEDHGAKRDGKTINDAAITVNTATLTSATAAFTAADVGKAIVVNGAGLNVNGNALPTTILAFVNATTVTLAAQAAVTVANARATYGTDDTAAIRAAVNAAVAAAKADRSYYAEVQFTAGLYMVASPPVKGGATLGNAQIPLPVLDPTVEQKFTLVLRGTRDATSFAHWLQTTSQKSGVVLQSTFADDANKADGTWGPVSVIGGPTNISTGSGFTNLLVVIDGITIVTPKDPMVIAFHLSHVAQANIITAAALADLSPAEKGTKSQGNGLGLAMPFGLNNDNSNVLWFSCEHFYTGITFSDHFTAQRLALIYCKVAMGSYGMGPIRYHGASILYASIEACVTIMEVDGNVGAKFPVDIRQINVETPSDVATDFLDAKNILHGYIGWTENLGRKPTVSGAANVKVTDLFEPPGAAVAPGVPATTVALTNPFARDAAVVITGGTVTVVAVAGQTLFTATGCTVIVPAGKTITLTYSVAPTWKWTLL